jgi:hypothetical protein
VQNVDPPVVEFGPSGFSRLGETLTPVPGGVLAGAPTAGDFPSAGGLVLRLDSNGVVLETYRKPEPEAADQYGTALAVNSTRVFVGVPGDDSGNVDAGAVYAYPLGVTTEEAIFRKRFVQAAFGTSIVADDATIAVGAPPTQAGAAPSMPSTRSPRRARAASASPSVRLPARRRAHSSARPWRSSTALR